MNRALTLFGVLAAVALWPGVAGTLAAACAFIGTIGFALGALIDERRLQDGGGRLAVGGVGAFLAVPVVAAAIRALAADPRVQVGVAVVVLVALAVALIDLASKAAARLPKREPERIDPPRIRRRAAVAESLVRTERSVAQRPREEQDDLDLLGRGR